MLTKNIAEMLSTTKQHLADDQVIQGHYWVNYGMSYGMSYGRQGYKGCFIGCLTHSTYADRVTLKYGIPLDLVDQLESIFEQLPLEDAKQFFLAIPTAIGCDGKCLKHIRINRNVYFRLDSMRSYASRMLQALRDASCPIIEE